MGGGMQMMETMNGWVGDRLGQPSRFGKAGKPRSCSARRFTSANRTCSITCWLWLPPGSGSMLMTSASADVARAISATRHQRVHQSARHETHPASHSTARTGHMSRTVANGTVGVAAGLGIVEVQKAVREEMRQGCDQVKIMMSGGVASPYDPLDSMQYSPGEVRAAVEEAEAFGRYVCAHAYTPQAITRAAECGVRTIEHGNLIDDAAAKHMADKGMFLIANLIAYYAMKERAADYGMPPEMLEKNDLVIDGGLRSLEICKRAGVPVAYGTDLLGQLQGEQSREFSLRSQVLSPIEIIRSATLVGAQVVRREGKLGCLRAGAYADLLVIDGNPLKDLSVFENHARLSAIVKGGQFHKNTLH